MKQIQKSLARFSFVLALPSLILPVDSEIARAEPAHLSGSGQAQAFTFSHEGQCYAITPNHVTRRNTFSLLAGNPERLGSGTMTALRFPGTDLALATVQGALAQNCSPRWSSLPRNLGRLIPAGRNGVLVTVRRNGLVEQKPVRLSPISYEHIGITPTSLGEAGSIGRGKSGSLLVVNNIPAGILIDLPADPKGYGAEARVLRMDAIVARLDRYIAGRQRFSGIRSSNAQPNGGTNLNFTVKRWNVQPTTSEFSPLNLALATDTPFVTPPIEKVLKLDLRLAGTSAKSFKEIIVESNVADGRHTAPKRITVLASNLPSGRSARNIQSMDMSPDGKYRLKLSGTTARWILLRVSSVWEQSKPVRIDRITIR